MSKFTNFFIMQCVIASRSKQALFWSFMYPLLMLILMLSVFGRMMVADDPSDDSRLMLVAGVFAITIMSGGVFALATVLPNDFQTGVYNRLKVTDLSRIHVVLGLTLRQFVVILLGAALVAIGAKLVFSATVNGHLGSVVFIIALGSLLFCSLGFLVANLCKPQSAAAVANVIFLIMMFLSGSTFPKAFFPDWLTMISLALPASYLYDLLESQLYYGEALSENLKPLVILSSMTLAAFVLAIKTFKWE